MVQITLEDTLSDFFAAEDNRSSTASPSKVFVSYNPISDRDLATELPRNTKYLIQQWRSSSDCYSPIMNLILMPQRMSWIVGKMPVIFFSGEGLEERAACNGLEDDLAETIGVIKPHYQFEPRFCATLEQICQSVGDSLVITFFPSDGLTRLPHDANPNGHYELLTKRALALSGLPIPKAQLIENC